MTDRQDKLPNPHGARVGDLRRRAILVVDLQQGQVDFGILSKQAGGEITPVGQGYLQVSAAE